MTELIITQGKGAIIIGEYNLLHNPNMDATGGANKAEKNNYNTEKNMRRNRTNRHMENTTSNNERLNILTW